MIKDVIIDKNTFRKVNPKGIFCFNGSDPISFVSLRARIDE